jgi:hypothetical protein
MVLMRIGGEVSKLGETDSMKSWKVGDILAISHELCGPFAAIADGCSLFVAEHEPREEDGKTYYGYRDAKELRPATAEDFERLIKIRTSDVQRDLDALVRLMRLFRMFAESNREQAKD